MKIDLLGIIIPLNPEVPQIKAHYTKPIIYKVHLSFLHIL